MPHDPPADGDNLERPYFLVFLGALGLLGCIALTAGTFVAAFLVPDHDWVSDTISDLAAGDNEIIMDLALYGFAAGLFALSLAASHAHLGRVWWTGGTLALAILAALVVVIGARNEYGDGDSEGIVLHVYFVYGLGALFLAAPLCFAADIGREHTGTRRMLIALGLVWGVCAPVFFFLPTSIDGAYERWLGLLACAIVLTLSHFFARRGWAG
ncbi:DUF998 domain-containing protein [Tropicimonas isoalkanivorans]|uniref:DUF998 domain-containing protein n=1 Tax=Tropicimonas isoalkanivorans TaxID=441112 RepID=UPI001FE02F81|nr:DUF998 domain-containing protein [Tropicimonas isoalkanivorans]